MKFIVIISCSFFLSLTSAGANCALDLARTASHNGPWLGIELGEPPSLSQRTRSWKHIVSHPTRTSDEIRDLLRATQARVASFWGTGGPLIWKVDFDSDFKGGGEVNLGDPQNPIRIHPTGALNSKWGYSWVALHEFAHILIERRMRADFQIYTWASRFLADHKGKVIPFPSELHNQLLRAHRIVTMGTIFQEAFADFFATRILNDPWNWDAESVARARDFSRIVSPSGWIDTDVHHVLTPFKSMAWQWAKEGKMGKKLERNLEILYSGFATILKIHLQKPIFTESANPVSEMDHEIHEDPPEAFLWGKATGLKIEDLNLDTIKAVERYFSEQ